MSLISNKTGLASISGLIVKDSDELTRIESEVIPALTFVLVTVSGSEGLYVGDGESAFDSLEPLATSGQIPDTGIPDVPAEDGEYTLTVADGEAEWTEVSA